MATGAQRASKGPGGLTALALFSCISGAPVPSHGRGSGDHGNICTGLPSALDTSLALQASEATRCQQLDPVDQVM